MIRCERCGTNWEDWALDQWDLAVREGFAEGRGCPDCVSLDDAAAARRREVSLRREAEASMAGTAIERVPGVSSILGALGILDIAGGVVLFAVTLGQKDLYGHVNVVAAFAWLLAGITSGTLLIGAGEALRSLYFIRRATSACAESLANAAAPEIDEPST